MQFDGVIDTLRAWMEAIRSWLLEQQWLGFAHDWIGAAAASTLWAIIVVSVAAVILLIGFWPAKKPKTPN